MNSLIQKIFKFNPIISFNFDGDHLTSDSRLILYKEFDEAIGVNQCIKNHNIFALFLINNYQYTP
ncbi:transposase [Oceanirhabdus seepicola]|uniref:Uncharacterized protein n=1 Tax=Oceanirhabdus seepicola TaxID=2828781 RepID=A0A9J6PCG9_9CLOT|nr:transposase [Oceanirhabdus seepicola]MCM1992424.1 hypothetical protein [Oceanirhabdus seepicola]